MTRPALKSALAFSSLCLVGAPPVAADYRWFPQAVEVTDIRGVTSTVDYVPLAKARKAWQICVSLPHVKDEYWLAVNYGVADEAERLGVRMRLHEAGGYDNADKQRQQIDQCVAQGANAVVLGAISENGLNEKITQLKQKGIPVIDLVNGVSSPDIAARSRASFEQMGYQAGRYIAERLTRDKATSVLWFPGPSDAAWVRTGDVGFRKALTGSRATILAAYHGDTGIRQQTRLLEQALAEHPAPQVIAGTAVTILAAIPLLKKMKKADTVTLVSYYLTPGVFNAIRHATVAAAPTELPVIQARVAMDQAVRILEKQDYHHSVSPPILLVTRDNIDAFDRLSAIAPTGFHIKFDVN